MTNIDHNIDWLHIAKLCLPGSGGGGKCEGCGEACMSDASHHRLSNSPVCSKCAEKLDAWSTRMQNNIKCEGCDKTITRQSGVKSVYSLEPLCHSCFAGNVSWARSMDWPRTLRQMEARLASLESDRSSVPEWETVRQ